MAELQPPEGPVNGGGGGGGGGSSENVGAPGLGTKRQRRPSVRLGDIGGQPPTLSYDSYVRRTKQWTGSDTSKYHRHPSHSHSHSHKDTGAAGKSSKTRPLTNLGNGGGENNSHETLEIDDNNKNGSADGNFDLLSIRKAKRGGATKRVRSNWVSKPDQETTTAPATVTATVASGEDGGGGDEGFRDFDPEGSQSPLKDQSPVHSLENPAVDLRQNSDRGGHGIDKEGLFLGKRRSVRTRVSESRDHNDGVELELDGPSDTDGRDWKCGTSTDRNGGGGGGGLGRGRFWSLEDGVRMWLNGLGLGQYAAVFEIHEVDEEVLPQLTLEDLKDMGINAVGSRRKLYSAIQKLAKGFS